MMCKMYVVYFFFFKQKTAYEMRISDWSSDVCSSDLVGIGHDRRRVGVDEDDAIALLLQRLDRLRPRIIELARLTDNNRAGADDEDGLDVSSFGHYFCSSFADIRSEEHTSELQSLMRISYAVFCLKNKKNNIIGKSIIQSDYA